jgi:hypothetical protein
MALSFGIKISALRGPGYRPYKTWGDFQFADALREALERLGHRAFVDPPWRWYGPRDAPDDVVVVIRGLLPYEPQPGQINLLWNINHPDDVLYEEYEAYDIAFVASQSYARFLCSVVKGRVEPLLQATDPSRFHPPDVNDRVEHEVLFVGNTRRKYRDIVRWAVEGGVSPAIYGTGWEAFVPDALIKGDFIANRELRRYYGGAGVVLNDHFQSMRDFGFVSNRIYDVLASGGRVISDAIPSIARIFGDAVEMVQNAAELQAALAQRFAAPPRDRATFAQRVAGAHSFDRRAEVIADRVMTRSGTGQAGAAFRPELDDRRGLPKYRGPRVTAIVRVHGGVPDDAAFLRLISPLTHDEASIDFKLAESHANAAEDGEICLVQTGSIARPDEAAALLTRLRLAGARLVVDVDRAELSPADRELIASADQVWLADEMLLGASRESGPSREVVPTGIDRRIWKLYGDTERLSFGTKPLRLLLVVRSDVTGCDFLWPALDTVARRAPGAFSVTVCGHTELPYQRDWLWRLRPPPLASSYPRFARWLMLQEPFEAALCPHTGTSSGRLESEVRFLEACAMGLPSIRSRESRQSADPAPASFCLDVGNDEADWVAALTALFARRMELTEMRSVARSHVWGSRCASRAAVLQSRLLNALVNAP